MTKLISILFGSLPQMPVILHIIDDCGILIYIHTKLNISNFWGEKKKMQESCRGWGGVNNTWTSVMYCIIDGVYLGGGFSKCFKLNKLFCLIRDLPTVQELWGRGDHTRGSEAVFSSILNTRLTWFLNIPSGLPCVSDGSEPNTHPCDLGIWYPTHI